jgi:SAM-dependent methyltransferase
MVQPLPGSVDAELLNRESEFHDDWAASEDPTKVFVDESFEACTAPENRQIRAWLGDIRGLELLELGCGCGEASVFFAKLGAKVTATDLSPGMLDLTKRVADHHHVELATKVASSEVLPFPDQSFDIVYGANVLHHSDIAKAIQEVNRVLRPGGRVCFWDPLAANPVINVYRRMASKVRTPDEHPLTTKDLRFLSSSFSNVEIKYFWFCTLLIFLKFYLIDRVHPNQDRYWKKIIREAKQLERLYTRLEKMDRFILRCLPFLKRWCWNVTVCGVKKS